jgi:pilus assembly protein CpaB
VKRGSLAAVLTLLFALAAAAGVFLYVQNARERAVDGEPMVTVVVGTSDIPAGENLDTLIRSGAFTTKQVPRSDVIQNAYTDPAQLQGLRTAYPILAGEQISPARMVGDLQAAGGRYGLRSGYQAVSLSLEPQRAVAGRLQSGDYVEAYGTFTEGQDAQVTRFIVPDAQVLSVTTDETGSGGSTVLLAVGPEEAQRLIYAQEQGTVWLTLLPPNEDGATRIAPLRSKELA